MFISALLLKTSENAFSLFYYFVTLIMIDSENETHFQWQESCIPCLKSMVITQQKAASLIFYSNVQISQPKQLQA